MFIFKSNTNSCPNKISFRIRKFLCEKKIFEEILSIYGNKVLFPKEFVKDIKNTKGLSDLYHYIEGYNNAILEARKLHRDLKKVPSWGYIFNTYEGWNYSVNVVSYEIKKYTNMIHHYVQKQSEILNLFDDNCEYFSWLNKFITFLYLRKNNSNPNDFVCVMNIDSTHLIYNFNLEQVKKLLPTFMNLESKENLKYYMMEDLDSEINLSK